MLNQIHTEITFIIPEDWKLEVQVVWLNFFFETSHDAGIGNMERRKKKKRVHEPKVIGTRGYSCNFLGFSVLLFMITSVFLLFVHYHAMSSRQRHPFPFLWDNNTDKHQQIKKIRPYLFHFITLCHQFPSPYEFFIFYFMRIDNGHVAYLCKFECPRLSLCYL